MTQYLGEIRIFAGTFAPAGWAFCDGQLYPISEYEQLFQLIGTTYGGDGESTFAVPNLASRVPMHVGSSDPLGSSAGVESVTLSIAQMAAHNHALLASEATADSVAAAGNVPAEASKRFYVASTTPDLMAASMINPAGGSQPHDNMQPYCVINFILALFGVFPSAT